MRSPSGGGAEIHGRRIGKSREGEGGEGSCACAENGLLRRSLQDYQEKYSKTLKLLKVREMELDILKNTNEVVQIE